VAIVNDDETDRMAEMREQKREEWREARKAATVFACVCKEGDADRLYHAACWLNECIDAWRPAMVKVARLPHVIPEIQAAFLPVWIESKGLSRQVGNRRVLADALRVLFPCDYSGPPLTLYRGTRSCERRRRLYCFSWTTDIDVARKFAEPRFASEGVILQALAPPEAILLVRRPEEYQQMTAKGTWEPAFNEGEVVVDPFRLGKVEVVERLT
jgi:hypothetical protein